MANRYMKIPIFLLNIISTTLIGENIPVGWRRLIIPGTKVNQKEIKLKLAAFLPRLFHDGINSLERIVKIKNPMKAIINILSND